MTQPRASRAVVIALWGNALLLAGILLSLVNRGGSSVPSLLPAAYAQQAPIAGGAGVFVMPCQTSPNTWGAYLLDVDSQTLCVYQFFPGEKQLRLLAARNYKYDRRLNRFNSDGPSPTEVKALVEREAAGFNAAGNPPTAPTRQDQKLGNE
ncbi:MAG TPA: hypothetical protein VEA69_13805 [Tepidisphaeraceae bacterium]|nr:hypothetical protein [Tepidisphaeraceae bacterium]